MTTTPTPNDGSETPQVDEPEPPEADMTDPDGLPEPDPEDRGTGS